MSPKVRKHNAKDYSLDTGCGKICVTFRLDEKNNPINCKVAFGKSGVCGSSQTEAISRLVKILLKHNIAIPMIIKQLKGIHCSQQTEYITSCADAVAKAMEALEEDLALIKNQVICDNV